MNHLSEAKGTLAATPSKGTDAHAIAHALIAIAEQLERLADNSEWRIREDYNIPEPEDK